MKTNRLIACAFAFLLIALVANAPATAQQVTLTSKIEGYLPALGKKTSITYPHVAAYMAEPSLERSGSWWQAIQREVSLKNVPERIISEDMLNRLIYFQNKHGDQLDFTDSVPKLLNIYYFHADSQLRILAITALIEIDEPDSVEIIEHTLHQLNPEYVRDYAIMALYYHRRFKAR